MSHVDTKVEEIGVAVITGLKRPDPGLLIGLDINTVKAFIGKAFWKEVRVLFDNSFVVEILFEKGRSNLTSYYGMQWFCLTPHNLFRVKVEFNDVSQLRLPGCADLSRVAFFEKGVAVGDIAHSAAMAYGNRLKKVGFCVDKKGFGVYLEVGCASKKRDGDLDVSMRRDLKITGDDDDDFQ